MFPWEICKIFKNTYFEEHRWTTASTLLKVHSSTALVSPDQRYFQITTFSCFPRWGNAHNKCRTTVFRESLKLTSHYQVDEANTELECRTNHRATFTIILFDRLCPKNTTCKFQDLGHKSRNNMRKWEKFSKLYICFTSWNYVTVISSTIDTN